MHSHDELSAMIRCVTSSALDFKGRWQLYRDLIGVWKDFGVDEATLESCSGIDRAFDDAWNGIYPEEQESLSDEEILTSLAAIIRRRA